MYGDSGPGQSTFTLHLPSPFCQKVYDESGHFQSPDPIAVCTNHLYFEVTRAFLEWICQELKLTTAASLFTYAKAWRMGVIKYTRSPVDPSIKMDMKNVRGHVTFSLQCFSYYIPFSRYSFISSWIP